MDNISGEFELELCGSVRTLKCNFGVVEHLERRLFEKPILIVLNDAIQGNIFFHQVIDTIQCGLHANKDTRLTREEIGVYVQEKGIMSFLEWYISFLTYAVTGGNVDESEDNTLDPKKK